MAYKHKRSSVAGKVPVAADFTDGQILVNTADGRAFINTPSGVKTLPNSSDITPTNTTSVGAAIAAAAGGDSISDGDTLSGVLSGSSNMRRWTWGNIKSWLKTYFDTLYLNKTAQAADSAKLGNETVAQWNAKIAAAGNWPGVYTGSDVNMAVFPIGHTVVSQNANAINRNSSFTVKLHNSAGQSYTDSSTNTILAGVWRARGNIPAANAYLMQRTE